MLCENLVSILLDLADKNTNPILDLRNSRKWTDFGDDDSQETINIRPSTATDGRWFVPVAIFTQIRLLYVKVTDLLDAIQLKNEFIDCLVWIHSLSK